MKQRLAVLVQNELELNLNEIFREAVQAGVMIDHIPLYHTQNPHEVIQAAKDYDYIIAGREPWNLEVLTACEERLQMILRFGAGLDTVDLETATNLGIAVSSAPGANAKAVAEHTLALMMSLLRNVSRYDRELRRNDSIAKMSQSLEGTIALLGFGNIGREFARLLSVFPIKVIAYDPYPNHEVAKSLGVEMVDIETAITTADIISLHLPAVKEMNDFICRDTIAKMKDGVFIINTSRGMIVNEQDLEEALHSGKVAGAALDAFKNEPFDCASGLAKLPNTILTPHAAAVSTQGVRGVFESCARTLGQYLKGEKVEHIANPSYIYYRRFMQTVQDVQAVGQ